MLTILLIVLLVLILIGAAPYWPHSRDWGHGPVSVLGVVLVILLVIVLLRYL